MQVGVSAYISIEGTAEVRCLFLHYYQKSTNGSHYYTAVYDSCMYIPNILMYDVVTMCGPISSLWGKFYSRPGAA